MTRRGRPGKGLGHVDARDGAAEEKRRLRLILDTVYGERTVREAAAQLGLSEARFRALRAEALQGALDALAPRPPGRPPMVAVESDEVAALRRQVKELTFELQTAWTRTELALTMPHVLRDAAAPAPKKGGSRRRRRRWFTDATNGTDAERGG